MKLASIDVGSNASRLLIRSYEDKSPVATTRREHQPTYTDRYWRVPVRIGNDVYSCGEITPAMSKLLCNTLRDFALLMIKAGVSHYRACATAAMRDAANATAILRQVKEYSGIELKVISGDEEACLTRSSYRPPRGKEKVLTAFVDVGGGSTEISLSQKGTDLYARSLQMGSMRKYSQQQWQEQFAQLDMILGQLKTRYGAPYMVCTGGNIHKISEMLLGVHSGADLTISALTNLYQRLCPLSPMQIQSQWNISQDRADIIVPALRIYLRIAEGLGVTQLATPVMSLRYGILHQLETKYHPVSCL